MINSKNDPFSDPFFSNARENHSRAFEASKQNNRYSYNNSTNAKNFDISTIFKTLFVVSVIAITILTGVGISMEVNRLHGLIGKDVTYTRYVRTFLGTAILKYTETFTVQKYYASLLALGFVGCIGLGIACAAITMVLNS